MNEARRGICVSEKKGGWSESQIIVSTALVSLSLLWLEPFELVNHEFYALVLKYLCCNHSVHEYNRKMFWKLG